MPINTAFRTHRVGVLRAEQAGEQVRLAGWVHRRRDLGGLIFIDLRDRSGRVQLSFGPDFTPPDVFERASRLGNEWVIQVEGEVAARPAGSVNTELATGEIEVHVRGLEILNESQPPAIPVAISPGDELPARRERIVR